MPFSYVHLSVLLFIALIILGLTLLRFLDFSQVGH
jgi:hypothetical protein